MRAPKHGGADDVHGNAEEARKHVSLPARRGHGAQARDEPVRGGVHGGRVAGQAGAGQRRLPRALQAAVQVVAARQ